MSKYIDELLRCPSLSRKTMFNLAKIYTVTNDESQKQYCKDELIKAFSKLSVKYAIRYANKYHRNKYEFVVDDLASSGIIGIHKALEKFDPNMGVHFYSFVLKFIMFAVRWEAVRLKNTIHLPCNQAAFNPANWHNQVDSENIIIAIDYSDPCVYCNTNIIKRTILDAIEGLEDGEVIRLKYFEDKTYAEIANITGIKKYKISQIIKKQLPLLQEQLKELKGEVYGEDSI